MRALRRLAAFARHHVYPLALGAVVVGVAVGLYTGAALAGAGMFTAGLSDPMSAPGGEG